jgi:hypothetical protein
MKQIRDVLRLALENGLSQRQISACLGIARGSVKDYLTRSAAAGLSWPLPIDIDDAALERRLFPPLSVLENGRKPEPDWAEIHEAMKLKADNGGNSRRSRAASSMSMGSGQDSPAAAERVR